ncbi:MAG: ATP-dependent helicase HrpB [Acidobacteriota bacterium]
MLPVARQLDAIRARVDGRGALVLVAPPGSGKTTQVPPALLDAGPLLLLQPRRVAARATATRIAEENGWRVGEEVGWQVRFERRSSKRTRLLVATEGLLVRKLVEDPLLESFVTVVLDELHERSVAADLGLALLREARRARPELRVVAMSATIDAEPVAAYLDAEVLEVDGRAHPVTIEHAVLSAEDAVRARLREATGHVLCFLPGAPEIRRLAERVRPSAESNGFVVHQLHGSLEPAEQDAAIAPSERPKLVLATNVAETSLTIDGVTEVIDSGLHKVLRHDAGRGLDRLETERVAQDSADQRAGRAGRTGPGRALRLWNERDRLRPQREPELLRVDLAPPLLDLAAWGADPRSFEWLEAPPSDRVDAALELLQSLGAIDGDRLTPLGDRLRRLGLAPRLGRLLIEAGGSALAASACAALSEGFVPRARRDDRGVAVTDCDLLALADELQAGPRHLRRAADSLAARARAVLGEVSDDDEQRLRHAVFLAYPDRLARRREPGSPRLLLASGGGAVLARESGVRDARFVTCVDLLAARRGAGAEASVRVASAVDDDWVEETEAELVHELHDGKVRAWHRRRHGALLLGERPAEVDPEQAAELLVEELTKRGLPEEAERTLRRLRHAALEVDVEELLRVACHGRTTLPEVDLLSLLPWDVRTDLDRLSPERLDVPSGRTARLDYPETGGVRLSIKLQELFGLAESPRVGPHREPVTLSLLAPNGRPVQLTRDLRSFWETTYPEVRKELRGRYPKHPWPEDPWSAEPTARTKRRK